MDKEEAFRLLLLILVRESTMKIHHANHVILIGKVLQAWNYESNVVARHRGAGGERRDPVCPFGRGVAISSEDHAQHHVM